MNRNLAQFAEDLRGHLDRLQGAVGRISALMSAGNRVTEDEFAMQLAQIERATIENIERARKIRTEVQARLVQEIAYSPKKLREWKARRQSAHLHAHADLVEQAAVAAMELAVIAILDAECTTMRAIWTRRNAVAVQIQRG